MDKGSLRTSASRGTMQLAWLHARFSFSFGPYQHPERQRFGVLLAINEDRIQPGTGFAMHPHHDLEILMLPLAGAIAHSDSLGNRLQVLPGEVLYMRAGSGIEHAQMNGADGIDHHLQIWLEPAQPGAAPAVEHRRFPPEGRVGRWQLIASGDGRDGSIAIGQDAAVLRAGLGGATPLAYRPGTGRSVYLHVIAGALHCNSEGEATLLHGGDALAWTGAPPLTLVPVGGAGAEVLLLDLPPA